MYLYVCVSHRVFYMSMHKPALLSNMASLCSAECIYNVLCMLKIVFLEFQAFGNSIVMSQPAVCSYATVLTLAEFNMHSLPV